MHTRVPDPVDVSCTVRSVAAWGRALAAAAHDVSLAVEADGGAPRGDAWAGAGADGGPHVPSRSAELVDLLSALEDLTAAAAAVQARVAVELDATERARQAELGVPADRRGAGVAAQVALARRVSPHRGTALLGAAKAWCTEMPHTFAALAQGHVSEHRAVILVRETACLTLESRTEVDRLVCGPGPGGRRPVDGLGDARLTALARKHAARLEPASLVRRARRAEQDRSVSLRPAPDTMTYLTALVPVTQGVAAYANLRAAASSARATGDPRSLGQVMADTLVERLTGQATAEAVPIAVQLVVSDEALLAAGSEPGHVVGGGTVPAAVARTLTANALDADAAWLRRIYVDAPGRLTATSSQDRFFAGGLADLLRIRDLGTCRTPWCDAPIRHLDHVVAAERQGPTSEGNGQGLCEACNHAKEAPGWSQTPLSDEDHHTVATTTPTGHRYRSRAPDLPRPLHPVPARAPAHRHTGGGSAADPGPASGTVSGSDDETAVTSIVEDELTAALARFAAA